MNIDDMFHTAYLLGWIDTTKFPLTVTLSMHSEDASAVTKMTPSLVFTLHKTHAETFEGACKKIIYDINNSLPLKELRPYFHPVIGPQLHNEVEKYINNLPNIMAKVLGGKK